MTNTATAATDTNTNDSDAHDTIAREEQFQLATYKKMPLVAVRGAGAWIETDAGECFLDLYGGHAVCATGHCHPHVVAALKQQAEALLFYSNLVYSDVRARAAEELIKRAPGSLSATKYRPASGARASGSLRAARRRAALCRMSSRWRKLWGAAYRSAHA